MWPWRSVTLRVVHFSSILTLSELWRCLELKGLKNTEQQNPALIISGSITAKHLPTLQTERVAQKQKLSKHATTEQATQVSSDRKMFGFSQWRNSAWQALDTSDKSPQTHELSHDSCACVLYVPKGLWFSRAFCLVTVWSLYLSNCEMIIAMLSKGNK